MTAQHATKVYFDTITQKIIIILNSGIGVFFSSEDVQGLEKATLLELEDVHISSDGLSISFPQRNVDLYVPGIMEGKLGSESWMKKLEDKRKGVNLK